MVLYAWLTVGCAAGHPSGIGPAGPWTPSPGIATEAKLTCATDGSTALSTDIVQARPDGVHLTVANEFNEPVSVEGFDANPGITRWTLVQGPGTMNLMCWPFSEHSSGVEPSRIPLEIVDPAGLYVDGSVGCDFEAYSTVDYFQEAVDRGPPPLHVARDLITGLRSDDGLRVAGYPQQEGASVLVIRDGGVVASYGITRFAGESWRIHGAKVCGGTGLRYEGKSFG